MDQGLVIEAADVILRPFRPDDLDAIYDLTQEAAVKEFLADWNVPKPRRREWLVHYELPENERFTAAVAAGGHVSGLRLWLAITERATGQFVGWCCTGIKEELPRPNREVVYAVAERCRNRGYATQATRALIEFLFENTDVAVVNALALERNLASNKVIQKSGMSHVDIVEIDGERYHHYQQVRPTSPR